MIDKMYDKFYTTCDNCGEELPDTDTFSEAKRNLDEAGWRTMKADGEYIHLCPNCKEVM